MKKSCLIAFFIAVFLTVAAQKQYTVSSPDGRLAVTVNTGEQLTWQISHDQTSVLLPSTISLDATVTDMGKTRNIALSSPARVKKVQRKVIDQCFDTPFYKKSQVRGKCNEMTLKFNDGLGLQIRAYDDAAAYRIVCDAPGEYVVNNETADFCFDKDYQTFVPYVNDNRGGERYCYSFESYYDEAPLSEMFVDSLAITPLMVCLDDGKKAVILDAGVDDYPGMFLKIDPRSRMGLTSEFALLPVEVEIGGFNRLNLMPVHRADHIAEFKGPRALPWRVVVVTDNDSQLLDCDIAQLLAPECKIDDTSWIKPGKVAWDWWNTCTLTGVDFKTGMNTDTYKAFIDFAAKNGLEYIIIDEGWSGQESLVDHLNDEIDIKQIADYGKQKNVGVILWASWRNAAHDTDEVFGHYADLGIAGFKVDFMDRDDQQLAASIEEIAETAAKHHLLLDLHGMKPNGLQRAYPNVVNFEGVKGLENAKWEPVSSDGPLHDFPRYDVTAPYLRMLIGPMDYTPGAMTNKIRMEFRAVNDHPMSMGTRVHQMAMYTLYEAPLQMLADSPSKYEKEQECTDFIALVPTVFDETVLLAGEIGEYLAVARRKGDTWYVGAMTDWTPRDLAIDLSFLGDGTYQADIFADGVNADTEATDYRRSSRTVTSGDSINVHMMPGGGWTARFEKL